MQALGKQQLSHIRLTSSKTHISRDDIQSECVGVGRLTPIVHHQKSALRLLHNQGTGFKTLAQQDQGTEILFKKRLTDVKRSSEAKLQPRVQQLSLETMESDSPKGLDRALSPAMLAALKLHRSQRRPDTPPTGAQPAHGRLQPWLEEDRSVVPTFSSPSGLAWSDFVCCLQNQSGPMEEWRSYQTCTWQVDYERTCQTVVLKQFAKHWIL